MQEEKQEGEGHTPVYQDVDGKPVPTYVPDSTVVDDGKGGIDVDATLENQPEEADTPQS